MVPYNLGFDIQIHRSLNINNAVRMIVKVDTTSISCVSTLCILSGKANM